MQSLPRLTRNHARQIQQPNSQLRAMAARRLGEAVRGGKVTVEQAREAMREGECAVATAILPHLYQCNMDRAVPAAEIGNLTDLSAENLANLAPLLREMYDAGFISDEDMAKATKSRAGETILNLVLKGTDRVIAKAASKLPTAISTYTPFHVSPMALAITLTGRDAEECRVTSDAGRVVMSSNDTPFVVFPDPESKDELSAICCLVRGINDRSGTWMIVPPDDALSVIDGMIGELLHDVRVYVPQGPVSTDLPSNVLDMVFEYFGVEEDDAESIDSAIDQLNEMLDGYIVPETWKMGDGKVEKWLKAPTGPNASMIQKLYDFYTQLEAGRSFNEREVVGGEYHSVVVFIVPLSFWHNFQETIQHFGNDYCPSEVFTINKSAKIKRPHLAALEVAVMATSVATAMTRIIIDEYPD